MSPSPEIRTPDLGSKEFEQIRHLMRERFGIELAPQKKQMVAARLAKALRGKSFNTYAQYFQWVISDRSGSALRGMADLLTTNHTSFFREPLHFEFLKQWLVNAVKQYEKVRIWSAACATGEEPYSIATCVIETLGRETAARKTELLATDISTRALKTGVDAVYAASRFDDLPLHWRRTYLLAGKGQWAGSYRFKPFVREMIRFGRLNLVQPLPEIGMFHIIFCRNVMIYFADDTRELVVNRLAGRLVPEGYLFVGHSEGLFGIHHSLANVKPAIYQQRGSGSHRSIQ